ncbi:MAG: glycerophosphodiester phosphodiesterase [Actinobacteria bacterium]|nr:glycerophosphodiester phosphodiesterase [Actinomycetota bacterium]
MKRLLPLLLLLALPGLLGLAGAEEGWLDRRVLNIAHQGGEFEAPSDTLYALKTAAEKGADVLEIDVHATAPDEHGVRELVAIHDTTVDRTTDGSGRVDELTLDEIQSLDAAYWFVPGPGTCNPDFGCTRPEADYVHRGIATGDEPPPEGFAPEDFRIPTVREILEEFPDELINIEIKRTAPDTEPYEELLADLLAEFDRTDDVIVVAFSDLAVERFKLHAPDVDTAVATAQAAAFKLSADGPLPGAPNPRYVALQVPVTFEGIEVVTEDFVRDAHANGLAVHVWTINDRATMEWLIAIGVDGIMTDRPTLLEEVLGACAWNPARPVTPPHCS